MKLMNFYLTILLLFCFISIITSKIKNKKLRKAHFTDRCGYMEIDKDGVLTGVCAKAVGKGDHITKVKLNKCIGVNDEGELEWKKKGDFTDKCSNCKLIDNKRTLQCECKKKDKNLINKDTKLDIDSGISNKDGFLMCDNNPDTLDKK